MVEGAALEKRCAREGTAGSNPALSVPAGGASTCSPSLVIGKAGWVDTDTKGLKDAPVLRPRRRSVYLQSFPSHREGRMGRFIKEGRRPAVLL